MILNGISLKGAYHERNQDGYIYKRLRNNGFIITVSDGLGSKLHSHIGARKLCYTAYKIVKELGNKLSKILPLKLVEKIHKRWIKVISSNGVDVQECSATMLILVVFKNRAIAIRLGDGFIALSYDNSVKVLFDKKEDNFANETYCLSSHLYLEEIEFLDVKVESFAGAVLCTDGLMMQDDSYEEFTKDFLNEYRGRKRNIAKNEIYKWLKDWTGSDDKTLAYCVY